MLQKRRDDAQAKTSAAQGPVINFNMPPELFGRPRVMSLAANTQTPSEMTVTLNSLFTLSAKYQATGTFDTS